MRLSLACVTAAAVLLSATLPAWAADENDFGDVVRNLPQGGNGKGNGGTRQPDSNPNPNRFIISGMKDQLEEDSTEADAMKSFGGKAKMRLKNKHEKRAKLVMEFPDAASAEGFKKKYKAKVKMEQDLPRYADAGLRHGNKGKSDAEAVIDSIRNLQSQEVPWGINNVFDDEFGNRGIPGSQDGPILPTNVQHPICIIDSGYEMSHPDLPKTAANADPGQSSGSLNFAEDGCGHGSHVAGTIAAINNGVGVIGVYPDADKIKVVKVFGTSGSGSCYWSYTSSLVNAYNYCVDSGAKIVSMSLGGGGFSSAESNAYRDGTTDDDMLIIAAAGNGGDSSYSYPASYDDVMSVAAIDVNNNKASFSQFNNQVDIAGPGVDVLSTVGGGYQFYSGTSMATPHVSGVALLLWNNFPTCKNFEIRRALEQSAKDLGAVGQDPSYGHGAVKYWAAFDYLTDNPCGTPPPPPPPTPSPTPCTGKMFELDILTDNWGGETTWELTGPQGVVAQDGPYPSDSAQSFEECIPDDVCTLTIYDSYGDGMCCLYGEGNFEVRIDGVVIAGGGEFEYSQEINLCEVSSPPAPTPNPTPAPTPNPTPAPTPNPTPEPTLSTTPVPPSSYLLVAPQNSPDDPYDGYGLEGYFFDLQAKSTPVAIQRIKFHTSGAGDFSLFTKSPSSFSDGSTFNFEDRSAWQTIFDVIPVSGSTTYTITFGSPLVIPAGEMRPFHFFSTGGLSGHYSPGSATYWDGPYPLYREDDSLILSHNFAVPYLWGNSFYGGYNMNGIELEYTYSSTGTNGVMSGGADITKVASSSTPRVESFSIPGVTGVALKAKNASCKHSSECLSNDCHGNGKCK